MNSKMEKTRKSSFEEGWPLLQTAVDKLINQVEEGEVDSSFTTREYMSCYTIVYELTGASDSNTERLYDQYKKVFEEYINSTVLPSLKEKKDELLLRELLKRWSNYKIITKSLSRVFCYLERFYIPRMGLPSLEETAFLSFYDLVYDEVNKQVMDAFLAMIGDSTGKYNAKYFAERMIKENATLHYDETSNWIASLSLTDNTTKEEKLKIKLISSDGDVFEVDYDVALMSQTIKDVIKTNPLDDIDSIPVSLVSSEMLAKVIEYCKKHSEKHVSDVDLMKWDADFVNFDSRTTLIDLLLSANYLNINSLRELTCDKIADMIKGKTAEEIQQFFSYP